MAVITKRKNSFKSKFSMKTKKCSKSKSNSKTRKQFKNIRKNGMGTRKMMRGGFFGKSKSKRKGTKQSQLPTKVKSNPYEAVKTNPYEPEKTPTPFRTYTVGNETFTSLIPTKRTTKPTRYGKNNPQNYNRLSQFKRQGPLSNNEKTNLKASLIKELPPNNNY